MLTRENDCTFVFTVLLSLAVAVAFKVFETLSFDSRRARARSRRN